MSETSGSKKEALFRRLRGYGNSGIPYIAIEKIRKDLEDENLVFSPNLLREYLSEAIAQGVIHDAGRGWYSPLSEASNLDPTPVLPLVEELQEAFPLLDFTAWATTQLNPWMRHLFNHPLRFVSCPRDSLDTVYEFLKRRGHDVWLNPRKSEATTFVATDRSIILRPSVSKRPSKPPFASVEQVLVDLCIERRLLPILDESEFQQMADQISFHSRLVISELYSYSLRRKIPLDEIFTKPIISTFF